jgi:hypothetical protein
MAKGRIYHVFTKDDSTIAILNLKLGEVKEFDVEPNIRNIERYSAYIMIQYDKRVEFFEFESRKLL